MQTVFNESLGFSFQKVVEESVSEIFNGKGMTEFQISLKDGMNEIYRIIQKRVMEQIDSELIRNLSLRRDWLVERRNNSKTIVSPFDEVNYDLEATEFIFISGDGAPWIKAGANKNNRKDLFKAILHGERSQMNRPLHSFREEESRENSILDALWMPKNI